MGASDLLPPVMCITCQQRQQRLQRPVHTAACSSPMLKVLHDSVRGRIDEAAKQHLPCSKGCAIVEFGKPMTMIC